MITVTFLLVPSLSSSRVSFPRWKFSSLQHFQVGADCMYCSPLRCFSHCLPKLITEFRCGSQWRSHLVAVFIIITIIIIFLSTVADCCYSIKHSEVNFRILYFLDYLYCALKQKSVFPTCSVLFSGAWVPTLILSALK